MQKVINRGNKGGRDMKQISAVAHRSYLSGSSYISSEWRPFSFPFVCLLEPCTPSVLFPRPCPLHLWGSACGIWPQVWDKAKTSWEEALHMGSSSRWRSAFIFCSVAGALKRSWTERQKESISSLGRLIFPTSSITGHRQLAVIYLFKIEFLSYSLKRRTGKFTSVNIYRG